MWWLERAAEQSRANSSSRFERMLGILVFDESDRCVNSSVPAKGSFVIEYAIYWDWDIGHHYDLEHLWVYIGADGEVEKFEGSAHGLYVTLWPDPPTTEDVRHVFLNFFNKGKLVEKTIPPERTRTSSSSPGEICDLTAYSEPGKHAFTPGPEWFTEYGILICDCGGMP